MVHQVKINISKLFHILEFKNHIRACFTFEGKIVVDTTLSASIIVTFGFNSFLGQNNSENSSRLRLYNPMRNIFLSCLFKNGTHKRPGKLGLYTIP